MPIDSDLIHRLLTLSEADRAEMAHLLLVSLKPETAHADKEYDSAWAKEIDRRVDEVDRGMVKLVPWADAERRIRAALRKDRAE